MCMTRIGNRNVKVLKKHENAITDVRVELTRKMTIAGKIIYAVVVTKMGSGDHYFLQTYAGLGQAYEMYKQAVA